MRWRLLILTCLLLCVTGVSAAAWLSANTVSDAEDL